MCVCVWGVCVPLGGVLGWAFGDSHRTRLPGKYRICSSICNSDRHPLQGRAASTEPGTPPPLGLCSHRMKRAKEQP